MADPVSAAHLPGAISLPHQLIDEESVARLITLPREATCGCAAPSMHEPPRTG